MPLEDEREDEPSAKYVVVFSNLFKLIRIYEGD